MAGIVFFYVRGNAINRRTDVTSAKLTPSSDWLKYFFDVDPGVTDHLSRNIMNHGTLIIWSAGAFFRGWSDKAAELLSPILHELRSVRISSPEL